MSDIPLIKPYSTKQEALFKISKFANNLTWIVIIYYSARFFINCGNGYLILQQKQTLKDLIDFSGSINTEVLTYIVNLFLNIFSILVNGIIFALVLRGISVGLDMLVEIDLNYISKSQGERHE